MNEIVIHAKEGQVLDVRRPQFDFQALCQQAIEKGTQGVEVLERLLAMKEKEDAKDAKARFDDALRNFQIKCPKIGKRKGVPDKFGSIAYKYAPLEDIIETIAPVLHDCGLSFTFDSDVTSAQGWVIASCEIKHIAGHAESKKAKFPLGTKTGIMSDTQQYSAALSFANRRVLCNALGIVTVGEDRDGATHTPQQRAPGAKASPPAPKAEDADGLRRQLWAVMEPVRGETWGTARQWLVAQKIIGADQLVKNLTVAELTIAIEKTEIALNPE